jgi:opacity protein-like surface antigen
MKSNMVKGAVLCVLVSAVSWAVAANHPQSSDPMQKFYVGANFGYLHAPWKDGSDVEIPGTISFSDWKNGNGDLSFGANLGYMFQPWIGVEGGWMYVPTVKVTVTAHGYTSPPTEIKDNAYYAAMKLQHGLNVRNLSLYTKVGLGYQDVDVKNGGGMINNTGPIGVYGAVGLDYGVTQNILIDGSVSFLNGYTRHDKGQFATDLSYFNVGVSYLF